MFSVKEQQQILKCYNAGENSSDLARAFGVCGETVRKFLRSAGAPRHRRFLSPEERKEICRRYANGETSSELANLFRASDATVLNILREHNVPRRDPSKARMVYPIWHEAFSEPTSEAAYWIGFLMADGCVNDESKIHLSLAMGDIGHVEKLRSFLRTESRPIYRTPQNNSCTLKFHSRQMVENLASYGVVPRKSLIAEAKGGIDKHPAFWLGVLDGDGTIDPHPMRAIVRMVGTERLMSQFVEFLTVNQVRGYNSTAPSVHKLTRTGTLRGVSLCGRRAVNFLNLAYGSSPVCLDRKREKTMQLLAVVASRTNGNR